MQYVILGTLSISIYVYVCVCMYPMGYTEKCFVLQERGYFGLLFDIYFFKYFGLPNHSLNIFEQHL